MDFFLLECMQYGLFPVGVYEIWTFPCWSLCNMDFSQYEYMQYELFPIGVNTI